MKCLFFLCMAMVVSGTLLHIVGMATHNWIQGTDTYGHTLRIGLWKIYVEDFCADYPSNLKNSNLITCQAFSILAIISAAPVFVLCLVHLFKKDADDWTKKVQIIVSKVLSLFSGLCVMICIFVWRFGYIDTDQFTGFSFYLCIVGGSLLIVSSGVFNIYKRSAL